MSQSNKFVILRYDKDNRIFGTDEDIKQAYLYSYQDLDIINKKLSENEITTYIEEDKVTYINHFTKEKFDKILDVEFNSTLNKLSDYFNMSAYNKNNTIELTIEQIKDMQFAFDYLLLEQYNNILEEDAYKDPFILLFGEYFTPYYNYYLKDTCQEKMSYDDEYRNTRAMFRRLKIIFDIFLLLIDEDSINSLNYKLLYRVC